MHLTYSGLFLLLGLGHIVCGRGGILHLGLAIGLSFGHLARNGLATAPARFPLGLFLLLFFVLLVGRLGNLDDHIATVELLFVKELDSLLSGFYGGHGDKTVAR